MSADTTFKCKLQHEADIFMFFPGDWSLDWNTLGWNVLRRLLVLCLMELDVFTGRNFGILPGPSSRSIWPDPQVYLQVNAKSIQKLHKCCSINSLVKSGGLWLTRWVILSQQANQSKALSNSSPYPYYEQQSAFTKLRLLVTHRPLTDFKEIHFLYVFWQIKYVFRHFVLPVSLRNIWSIGIY